MQGTILLAGSGKMGCALLEGWFKRGVNPVDVMVVEPAGRDGRRAVHRASRPDDCLPDHRRCC